MQANLENLIVKNLVEKLFTGNNLYNFNSGEKVSNETVSLYFISREEESELELHVLGNQNPESEETNPSKNRITKCTLNTSYTTFEKNQILCTKNPDYGKIHDSFMIKCSGDENKVINLAFQYAGAGVSYEYTNSQTNKKILLTLNSTEIKLTTSKGEDTLFEIIFKKNKYEIKAENKQTKEELNSLTNNIKTNPFQANSETPTDSLYIEMINEIIAYAKK